MQKKERVCPNVSSTRLQQWGFRQCLPFSLTTLKGKHCRQLIAVMGVQALMDAEDSIKKS